MKALRIPAIAAAAGLLLLAILYHRVDPWASFGLSIDRREAIQRARAITSRYGVETASWTSAATLLTDEKVRAYRTAHPDDEAARWFTPLTWGVVFLEPGGNQSVRVRLFADGRLAEWERKPAPAPQAPSSATVETVLADLAGPNRSRFAASGRDWQWSAGRQFPLTAKIVTVERDGRIVSAILTPAYGKGFTFAGQRISNAFATGLSGFARFVMFIVALIFAVRACLRRTLSWRLPVGVLFVVVAWGLFMVWAGGEYQGMLYGKARGLEIQLDNTDGPLPISPQQQSGADIGFKIGQTMSFLGPVCMPFIFAFAYAGAALASVHARAFRKWSSLERLFGGEALVRQVSGPIAAGALCGILAAAAPLLVAFLYRAATLQFHDTASIAAPMASVGVMRFTAGVGALSFFGLLYPLAAALRRKWMRVAGLIAIALLYLASTGDILNRASANMAVALLTGTIYFLLYRYFDVLAVASAMIVSQAVAAPCILLAQPSGTLRENGVRLVAILAAAIAVCVNFAIRGRDAEAVAPEEELLDLQLSEIDAPSLSNRKRLEAEFQVARKAQQDALPAIPPVIPGYSLAGSCDPALQVGGDLYDLFHLPDGRLGIAVADVSGKGVPAALYMMVTKGLLTATAQNSSDLAYILREINGHLHRACKKKVFVTMAAVAMDPARRRLEYGRAGHNPIVWRRARRGETELRKPTGLGLGMFTSERFARSLRLEELELESGDAVVLYSDGVTEAVNATLDQYGEERLIRAVERADGCSAEETRAAILRDLAEFTDGTPARDDVTVVVLRVDALTYEESGTVEKKLG